MAKYLFFDGMSWPYPVACDELERILRYGQPAKDDLLWAASVVAAYSTLVLAGQRTRNSHVAKIKKAMKESP